MEKLRDYYEIIRGIDTDILERFSGEEYSYFIYTKNNFPKLKRVKQDDKKDFIDVLTEENFIEGRFFNNSREVRVYYDGEEFKTVCLDMKKLDDDSQINENMSIIDRKYLVKNRKEFENGKIRVREYLEKDKEDGEYRIIITALRGMEENDGKF